MEVIELRELQIKDNRVLLKINDYRDSKMLTDIKGNKFIESVPREVWEEAIKENGDIKVHYNHQNLIDIAKDVKFIIKDDGVYAEIILQDGTNTMYKDIKKNPSKYGVSFGFKAIKDSFTKIGEYYKRVIEKMELLEISILDIEPAYKNTLVEARQKDILIPTLQDKINQEIELMKLEVELMKLK